MLATADEARGEDSVANDSLPVLLVVLFVMMI